MSSSPLPFQRLVRDSFGQLVLTDGAGQVFDGVTPVRAHPISAPDEGISLVGPDGHELAWVERLSGLPTPERELLESEFAAREFVPTVLKLKAVSTFSTPSQWTVDTDRGESQFILKTEEDIRRLGDGRLLIGSSHGIHYLVPDRFALDRASKKLLERFL
ncbi:MAG: DUF1854 domain-containing protein [Burkholderiaceae bacterium]|nr:DUF1854 domain-containing protein [Roseateles sp.]MBV8470548.1 DUF1854 domain-containing protein [Burkholderiaceae bacterium]